MAKQRKHEPPPADPQVLDGGTAMIRVETLRKFPEVVTRLGGNPRDLLAKVQIDAGVLKNRHAVVPHRSIVQLLERAAHELRCPDFGMRLAIAQGGLKVLGPLEFAMRNSRSLREAFHYYTQHRHVYSTASHADFAPSPLPGTVFLRVQVLLARLPAHPQTVERSLVLAHHAVLDITRGQVRPREVWVMHEPLSPLATYQEYFGTDVRFGQSMNGLFFKDSDLDLSIPNVDSQLYELTADFIANRFPSPDSVLSTRVRTIVERLLLEGDCTNSSVGSMLGMHPRTLQRRLRSEGESFESIKDSVRRDLALKYLKQSTIPLIRVAKMLGYSETSALSRSCYRWFSVSPRQLRSGVAPVPANDKRTESA